MRAIAIESFETGPELVDLPVPQPGPGDVLVKVRTASLNGFDVAVASGMLQGMMEHRFPVVLGKDFAGTVEATGDGVSSVAVGDEVFGVLMREFLGDGTFGEYAVIPESIGLAKIAPGLEPDFVKGLGATHTVDYTGDISAQVRSIRPEGVHSAVHFAGDGVQLADLVIPNGRFASTLGLGADQLGDRDLQVTAVVAMPTADVLDRLAAEAVAGRLRVPVQRTYRLDEVPQAISAFSSGTLGKLAVTISD